LHARWVVIQLLGYRKDVVPVSMKEITPQIIIVDSICLFENVRPKPEYVLASVRSWIQEVVARPLQNLHLITGQYSSL
jgi:hypothetical protein